MRTRLPTAILTIGVLIVTGYFAFRGTTVHMYAMAQGDSFWQLWINRLAGDRGKLPQMAYALWKLFWMATGTVASVGFPRPYPLNSVEPQPTVIWRRTSGHCL